MAFLPDFLAAFLVVFLAAFLVAFLAAFLAAFFVGLLAVFFAAAFFGALLALCFAAFPVRVFGDDPVDRARREVALRLGVFMRRRASHRWLRVRSLCANRLVSAPSRSRRRHSSSDPGARGLIVGANFLTLVLTRRRTPHRMASG